MPHSPRTTTSARRLLSSLATPALLITATLGAVVRAAGVATPEPPAPAVVSDYAAVVAADEPIGYWPLSDSLDPVGTAPALEAGGGPARFRPGPTAGCGSCDLGRGGWLRIPDGPALASEEMTVEMVFQIKYPRSGALFGIRDGGRARFSLHYDDDSPVLRLWNGSEVVDFEADGPVTLNTWHHVAVAISPTESTVWLDGVRCKAAATEGVTADTRGLPFLVGCSDSAGKRERADILCAHLAIHPRRLDDARIAARLEALGWADRLEPVPPRDLAAEIARIPERVARLEREHGVKIQYEDTVDFIPAPWRAGSDAAPLPSEQLPRAIDEVEGFLAVVPAAVTRRDLDTIYVMNHLRMGPSQVGALAYEKSIYLPCGRPLFDIRCSLYHELSHILQVAHPIANAGWNELLPKGYAYGCAENANPFEFNDQLRNDGFILRYSTTNRHEDIAVLSDWLFVRKQQTIDLCEAYPAIRRKVAAVVDWYRAIDPGYDFSFYDAALADADPPTIVTPKK